MSVKFYEELVSPFVQTKVMLHEEALNKLQSQKVIAPVTCEIDLTDGICNNKCRHCFFGTNYKRNPVYIDKNVLKNVLVELKEIGVKAIEFTGGGEPTMHPDFLEIAEYVLKLDLELGIISNGLLLNKLFPIIHKVKYIRISLDAASSEVYNKVHGVNCYNEVVGNIKQAVQIAGGERIGIGYLIVPDNVTDIEKAPQVAYELGVRFLQYRPASLENKVDDRIWNEAERLVLKAKSNNSNAELQIFNAGIKWNHLNNERHYCKCYTSSIVAVIKANGDIPLCVLKRNDTENCVGNIYDGGFSKNWFSEKHEQLIERINLETCRKPCKHDSYNIVCEALQNDYYHKNFI